MHEKLILCHDCGKEYPMDTSLIRCKSCQTSLEVVYDYPKLRKKLTLSKLRKRPFSHSRYKELFPVKSLISLGEGGTPLLRSKNLEKDLNLNFELWFKVESGNPTGSFKDRGSSVEVSRAIETGHKKAIVASTGNMGASLSAYSAASGLSCSVYMPRDARPVKVRQILSYGAKAFMVNGDYIRAACLAENLSQEKKAFLFGDYLFRREGTKSIGFEIADQLNGVTHIISPVGNGTLLYSTKKAFSEWKGLGFSRTIPRMVAIQAFGCSPLVRALSKSCSIKRSKGKTIATAIECGDPLDGPKAMQAVKESGGYGQTVTDSEILRTRELLSRREGLFAEPAGAVSLAGLIKSKKRIKNGSRVVCLVTGHGLKAPHTPIRGKPIKL